MRSAVAAFVAEVIHMHDLAHGMPGNLHGNVCAVGADGRTAVSYTHLDVYKRQL